MVQYLRNIIKKITRLETLSFAYVFCLLQNVILPCRNSPNKIHVSIEGERGCCSAGFSKYFPLGSYEL